MAVPPNTERTSDSGPPPPKRSAQQDRTLASVRPAADDTGETLDPTDARAVVARREAHVPGYEILEELGRGGMGVVFKARQLKLNRLVAIKMILAGDYADETALVRFLAEAEAVARLQHPDIVQLFESSQHDGMPYFTLEYVPGGSLARKIGGVPLPPRQAARLLERLARATHHAHEHGIVHRDLKPANVLLAEDGSPKITDFGLAKRLEAGEGLTATGAVMGTPAYMAPEQARGLGKHVGPAADTYALGAILYECLTGRPPFQAPTSAETMMQVLGADPLPPHRLQPGLPRDLETVCLKCLAKDPKQRYASAGELADDLRRFLEAQPVRARPAGMLARLVKWARRRPALAALAAVCFLAALAFVGVGVYFTDRLRQERDLAVQREAETDEQRRQALKNADDARRQLERARRTLLGLQLLRVSSLWERDPTTGQALLDDPERCPPELRDFTWGLYARLCRRNRLTLTGHGGVVTGIAFTPDGKLMASSGTRQLYGDDGAGDVRLWHAVTGKELAVLKGHTRKVTAVAVSPDGKTLASGDAAGLVRLWDLPGGKFLLSLTGLGGQVRTVAFAPDSNCLAIGASAGLRLWDLSPPRVRLDASGGAGECVAFSPDGKTVAAGGWAPDPETKKLGGQVILWDVAKGAARTTLRGHADRVLSVAFSPDGKLLASGSGNRSEPDRAGEIRLWDVDREQVQATLRGHVGAVLALAFTADGQLLVSGSHDQTVKLWDVAARQEHVTFRGHTAEVMAVALSPGGTLASGAGAGAGDGAGAIKLWDVALNPVRNVLRGHTAGVTAVAVAADGQAILSAGKDRTVRVWNAARGEAALVLTGPPDEIHAVALAPGGQLAASGGGNGTVLLWDLARAGAKDGNPSRTLAGHRATVWSVAFSPDGKLLATASDDRTVRLWDVVSGEQRAELKGHTGGVHGVAFSADGKTLVTGSFDQTVKVWELTLLPALKVREAAELKGHRAGINGVAFSADGKTVASASQDQTIRLWDLSAGGKEVGRLQGHSGWVTCVAFTADGKTVASAGGDQTVRLWDVVTGQERAALSGPTGAVWALGFAADGSVMAAAGEDGTVRLWEALKP